MPESDSARRLEAWRSFLPEHALVMARSARPAAASAGAAAAPQSAPNRGAPEIAPGPAAPPRPAPDNDPAQALAAIAAELAGCTRCKLCAKRKTIVLGEGNPSASLVFVGEGPGEQEDIQGRPFVGKAGQLLDKMIEAMGLKRSDVFIANVVKCRPPGNRNPEPDEIESCGPFLYRQLDAIRPKAVVALGKFAAQTLLQTDARISAIRGRFFPLHARGNLGPLPADYQGPKLMPTFHPAYLLRNPESKREAWADLQAVAKELGIALPKR